MTELVKILMLEDSSDDVELIERELKRAGLSFETRVVNRRAEFEHGLEEFRPDVVLSDHLDVELIFEYILESIKEMDALVRTVVRKTEEMPDL